MAHATNLRAFRDCDCNEPFFRLYTLLVAVELALKDQSQPYISGHDISDIAARVFPVIPAGLSTQLTALSRSLAALNCTSNKGLSAPINPAKYPELRYVRHEADFPGETKAAHIVDALTAARQLIAELKTTGLRL